MDFLWPALNRAGRRPVRLMPGDLPPWPRYIRITRHWLQAGCFEAIVHDLRTLLYTAPRRKAQPSAAIFDSRTLQSRRESGERADYNGYQRRRDSNSKVHIAVNTLEHLLALLITPANEQDRAQVADLA